MVQKLFGVQWPLLLHVHQGATSRERIMKELLIPAGECTKKGSSAKNKKLVSQANSHVKEKQKKKHQTQQMLQIRREALK